MSSASMLGSSPWPVPQKIATAEVHGERPNMQGHMPALDGMRGLAILLVLVFHYFLTYHSQHLPGRFFAKLAGTGWCGVDLFFVLSGFLITGILYDAKGSRRYFRNFYAKRALRIFPLYYGILLVFFVLLPLVKPSRSEALMRPLEGWLWLYGANIKTALADKFVFRTSIIEFNHFWSLAVEEHFYFVWPLVILLLRPRAAMRVWMGLIVGSAAIRAVLFFVTNNDLAIYVLTPCRMDALAFGALVALAARGPGGILALVRPARTMLIAAAAACLALGLYERDPDPTLVLMQLFGYSLLPLFFGSLLVLVITDARTGLLGRLFRHPFLRFFGKYSYGLYVFHVATRPAYEHLLPPKWLTAHLHSNTLALFVFAIVGMGMSVVLAVMSWHLFEKHFLRLKEYFNDEARAAVSGQAGVDRAVTA